MAPDAAVRTDPDAARPAGRVRRFLDQHIATLPRVGRTRLPTARHLADQLQVSPQTILSVYREYARAGRVETRAGDGTFALGKAPPARDSLCIGLPIRGNPAAAGFGGWGGLIYAHVLSVAVGLNPQVSLLPLSSDDASEGWIESLLEQMEQADGVILLPTPRIQQVRVACEQAGKPAVTFNMPDESAMTDFVSPDYFTASRQVGRAWAAAGRRHILYLIGSDLAASVSARQRLYGLIAGFERRFPADVHLEVETIGGPEIEQGQAAMQRVLSRGGPPPDAVYCMGDGAALGAYRVLSEAGLRVPEEVSLIGGTGLDLTGTCCPDLTRSQQPIEGVATHLVQMLVQRIQQSAESVPGRLLAMPFIGGGTTTSVENQILKPGTA